jgi:YVTN family beta-propeller protein
MGAHAPAGPPIALEKKPGAVAISPDGSRLYVAIRDDPGAVWAINTATRAVEASAQVGKFPSDLALSADGSRLVSASFDDDTVTVIDPSNFTVLATYNIDTGTGIVLHPKKPVVYSMDGFNNTIAVLDYQTGADLPSISCGSAPTYSTITPDGRFLYVVNEESDNLVKIDTETGQPLLRIAVGNQPVDAVIVRIEK